MHKNWGNQKEAIFDLNLKLIQMKKLFFILLLSLTLIGCSNDEQSENNYTGISKIEVKIVNGKATNNTRPVTDPNVLCGEITETGIERSIPTNNVQYHWVVVCLN